MTFQSRLIFPLTQLCRCGDVPSAGLEGDSKTTISCFSDTTCFQSSMFTELNKWMSVCFILCCSRLTLHWLALIEKQNSGRFRSRNISLQLMLDVSGSRVAWTEHLWSISRAMVLYLLKAVDGPAASFPVKRFPSSQCSDESSTLWTTSLFSVGPSSLWWPFSENPPISSLPRDNDWNSTQTFRRWIFYNNHIFQDT